MTYYFGPVVRETRREPDRPPSPETVKRWKRLRKRTEIYSKIMWFMDTRLKRILKLSDEDCESRLSVCWQGREFE